MYRKIKNKFQLRKRKNNDKQNNCVMNDNVNSNTMEGTSELSNITKSKNFDTESQKCQPKLSIIEFETIAEVHVTNEKTKSKFDDKVYFNKSTPCTSDYNNDTITNFDKIELLKISEQNSNKNQVFVKEEKNEKELFEQIAEFYHQFPDLRTDIRIMVQNKTIIYLLGTNHADPQCPKDVANIIKTVKPYFVLIELCAWRACGCTIHRGNIFQSKPQFTFRYLRRVISQIGFLPAMIFFTDAFTEYDAVSRDLLDYGSEFAIAAHLCDELNDCKIILADREIPITVKRQASAMSNWRSIRLTLLVTLSLIFKNKMKTFLLRGHQLVIRDPRFYQIVVLERDIYLTYIMQVAASATQNTDNKQIVAVVGQGHVRGIQNYWGKILPELLPLILKTEVNF